MYADAAVESMLRSPGDATNLFETSWTRAIYSGEIIVPEYNTL